DRAVLDEYFATRGGRFELEPRLAFGRARELHRRGEGVALLVGVSEKRHELRNPVRHRAAPVDRLLFHGRDLEWALLLDPEDWVVELAPLLGVGTDVEIDARQRAEYADAVGAVEQHARRVPRIGVRRRLLDAGNPQVRRALP